MCFTAVIICIFHSSDVSSINTHMKIIRTPNYLKCKLFTNTFRGVTLRWHMGQPRLFITNYQDLLKKLVHQIAASKHRNMVATSFFDIHQGPYVSLREYLTRFNEDKIKVVNPNQELFVESFQNGPRVRIFNESLF